MKFLFTYAAIFGTAFAVPTPQGFGSTANDISSSVCKEVTFIFARGSTEGGNMGMAVGPPFANALKQSFGKDNVAVQGVDYPADIAGAITGTMNPTNAPGATKMTSLVQQALQKCPSTKVVLSGYSQGASQVHGALQNLKTDANKVAAVVTFGDPLNRMAFANIDQSKTKKYCASGDGVCNMTFAISAAHLAYASQSVQPAAQFVKSALGGAVPAETAATPEASGGGTSLAEPSESVPPATVAAPPTTPDTDPEPADTAPTADPSPAPVAQGPGGLRALLNRMREFLTGLRDSMRERFSSLRGPGRVPSVASESKPADLPAFADLDALLQGAKSG